MNLKGTLQKIPAALGQIKTHWSVPATGRHVPYKEFAAYSFGGIGISTVNSLMGYVALSANCFLIGSAYGLDPVDLAFMGVIMGIINLAKTPFVSMLIDNTNSRFGKFRPYLLFTGIPTVALLIAMAFIPIDAAYATRRLLVGLLTVFLSFFQSLYATAYASLAQVITPDSRERTSLMSVSAFIYNLGPSLVGIFLPILADVFWDKGLEAVGSYRVLFPAFAVPGLLLGMWTFLGTKERIIVPKNYVAKVPFGSGIKHLAQNPYFWRINIFNILGALRYGIGTITGWYCHYVLRNDSLFGVMNAVIGTASVPGMLLAPMIIGKLGKKRTLIYSQVLHALFALCMLFFLERPVPLFIFLYLSTLAMGSEYVTTQSMTADIYDYQQYKTGQRLEGFITQFGSFLVTGFGLLTGLIMPFFYRSYGLEKDYEVLFNAAVHMPIFRALIISTVISSLLGVIPLLRYNLTEKRHAEIIGELTERAEATL